MVHYGDRDELSATGSRPTIVRRVCRDQNCMLRYFGKCSRAIGNRQQQLHYLSPTPASMSWTRCYLHCILHVEAFHLSHISFPILGSDRLVSGFRTATMATEMKNQEDYAKRSIDYVDDLNQSPAVHTDLNEVPSGYWRSYQFLGTVVAIILLANSLFIGYVMPVCTTAISAGMNSISGTFHYRSTSSLSSMKILVCYRISHWIYSNLIPILGPSPDFYLITLVFTLVSGVLLLVVGRLSDIVGRRYFIVGGQLFAIIGSIICAKATSIHMVIGGTVITACAGAIQTLFPLPNKHRSYGLAVVSLGFFPTIGGGPAIARALVQHTVLGWRYLSPRASFCFKLLIGL
jgi:hypothetical protein